MRYLNPVKSSYKGTITAVFLLAALALLGASAEADTRSRVEAEFWGMEWKALEASYQGSITSPDQYPAFTPREKSLYVNALWRQGKYAEVLEILGEMTDEFPSELMPYAQMLYVLGKERTGVREEAYERGRALWEIAPDPLKYYLAYAMARVGRDLEMPADSLVWFRRMLELAPDRKRRVQALVPMLELPGVMPDEAAQLLIDTPSSAKALEFCRALSPDVSSKAEYALGYNAYINKKYDTAARHFKAAASDDQYGEAAQYYHAYSAYRQNDFDTAYRLWSAVALSGNDYPQRSVARLGTLATKTKKSEVLATFSKVAATRDDYPDLAADALVGIIRLGSESQAEEAEKRLFSERKVSNQAATARWEKGWKAWKAGSYKAAYDQWAAGALPGIPNRELGARLYYWQIRALERMKSPVAAERVRGELVKAYPAEYHTFLAVPDGGGIVSADVPEAYMSRSLLEEWGFVTYARLEGAEATKDGKPDLPALYSAIRLSLWEGDYSSAVRSFGVLQRHIPQEDYAKSELLKSYFPRAFEPDVRAASEKTGVAPEIIWGVMRQESLYEPDVTSTAGAYGLMQLMPATAKGEAKKMNLPEDAYKKSPGNILLGANHLVGLFARFKDMPRSLAAYNAGGSPVTRWSREPIDDMTAWVEDIGYPETRGYVKAVLRNIDVYRTLYPKKK